MRNQGNPVRLENQAEPKVRIVRHLCDFYVRGVISRAFRRNLLPGCYLRNLKRKIVRESFSNAGGTAWSDSA